MITDEYLPLDSLLPDTANYNRHSGESIVLLASQISSVGFTAPFLVDAKTKLIAAGHRRRLALFKLRSDGHPEPAGVKPGWLVPCRVGEWSEIQRLKVLVGDNPRPDLLDYDTEALTALLSELSNAGELAGSGYDESRLEALIGELAGEAEGAAESGLLPDADPDEVPEASSVPARCRPGDLWRLGEHVIGCLDCRDAASVDRLLQGRKINVCVTSPPYASQRKYDEESGFRPIPPDEYVDWFDAVQANIREHLAEDGSFFLNIKEHCEDGQRHLYVKDLTIAHVRFWDWRFVDEFCWKRPGVPGLWPNRFKNAWEPIFHFTLSAQIKLRAEAVVEDWVADVTRAVTYDEGVSLQDVERNRNGSGFHQAPRKSKQFTGALPDNVIEASGVIGIGHSAAYPVGLPEFFLKAFSDAGDVVYDPFMGSGTTLMAAEKTGRLAFGCEISPKYCDVILSRWETATGRQAELLERIEAD